jgi:hypothetical protein
MKKYNFYTTICIDYPTELCFKTKFEFNNNEERTNFLIKKLRNKKVDSPCHNYEDYVVEYTEKIRGEGYEYWAVAS